MKRKVMRDAWNVTTEGGSTDVLTATVSFLTLAFSI